MTKTSRTHCARPVKTIQRLYAFQNLFELKDYEAQQK